MLSLQTLLFYITLFSFSYVLPLDSEISSEKKPISFEVFKEIKELAEKTIPENKRPRTFSLGLIIIESNTEFTNFLTCG